MTVRKSLLWASLLLAVTNLFSQEKGQLGLGFKVGSSQSLGVTWHLSKTFALRPGAIFRWATINRSDVRSVLAREPEKELSVGGSFSGLFYLGTNEKLSIYVGPEFEYLRTENNARVSSQPSPIEENVNEFAGKALFGLQYPFSQKFSIYGEVGLRFSFEKKRNSLAGQTETKAVAASNSGLGFIFYFD
jgi:hypothetical protein